MSEIADELRRARFHEAENYQRWQDALAVIGRVRSLLGQPVPPKFDALDNYEGRVGGTEHRTVGSHRAWCYQCSEWCYPESWACPCCEPPIDRDDLRAALKSTEEPA